MNYTPFSGHFATQVPAGTVQHYTTAKFAQNVAAPAGQVHWQLPEAIQIFCFYYFYSL